MTNLGAGFPVGSPETAGPPLPSSSGPPSERDRYKVLMFSISTLLLVLVNVFWVRDTVFCVPVFCSRQLMPPPPLPVHGSRPKMEERRAPQGPVGKTTSKSPSDLRSAHLIMSIPLPVLHPALPVLIQQRPLLLFE